MNENIKETWMHVKGLSGKDFAELHRLVMIEYRERLL